MMFLFLLRIFDCAISDKDILIVTLNDEIQINSYSEDVFKDVLIPFSVSLVIDIYLNLYTLETEYADIEKMISSDSIDWIAKNAVNLIAYFLHNTFDVPKNAFNYSSENFTIFVRSLKEIINGFKPDIYEVAALSYHFQANLLLKEELSKLIQLLFQKEILPCFYDELLRRIFLYSVFLTTDYPDKQHFSSFQARVNFQYIRLGDFITQKKIDKAISEIKTDKTLEHIILHCDSFYQMKTAFKIRDNEAAFSNPNFEKSNINHTKIAQRKSDMFSKITKDEIDEGLLLKTVSILKEKSRRFNACITAVTLSRFQLFDDEALWSDLKGEFGAAKYLKKKGEKYQEYLALTFRNFQGLVREFKNQTQVRNENLPIFVCLNQGFPRFDPEFERKIDLWYVKDPTKPLDIHFFLNEFHGFCIPQVSETEIASRLELLRRFIWNYGALKFDEESHDLDALAGLQKTEIQPLNVQEDSTLEKERLLSGNIKYYQLNFELLDSKEMTEFHKNLDFFEKTDTGIEQAAENVFRNRTVDQIKNDYESKSEKFSDNAQTFIRSDLASRSKNNENTKSLKDVSNNDEYSLNTQKIHKLGIFSSNNSNEMNTDSKIIPNLAHPSFSRIELDLDILEGSSQKYIPVFQGLEANQKENKDEICSESEIKHEFKVLKGDNQSLITEPSEKILSSNKHENSALKEQEVVQNSVQFADSFKNAPKALDSKEIIYRDQDLIQVFHDDLNVAKKNKFDSKIEQFEENHMKNLSSDDLYLYKDYKTKIQNIRKLFSYYYQSKLRKRVSQYYVAIDQVDEITDGEDVIINKNGEILPNDSCFKNRNNLVFDDFFKLLEEEPISENEEITSDDESLFSKETSKNSFSSANKVLLDAWNKSIFAKEIKSNNSTHKSSDSFMSKSKNKTKGKEGDILASNFEQETDNDFRKSMFQSGKCFKTNLTKVKDEENRENKDEILYHVDKSSVEANYEYLKSNNEFIWDDFLNETYGQESVDSNTILRTQLVNDQVLNDQESSQKPFLSHQRSLSSSKYSNYTSEESIAGLLNEDKYFLQTEKSFVNNIPIDVHNDYWQGSDCPITGNIDDTSGENLVNRKSQSKADKVEKPFVRNIPIDVHNDYWEGPDCPISENIDDTLGKNLVYRENQSKTDKIEKPVQSYIKNEFEKLSECVDQISKAYNTVSQTFETIQSREKEKVDSSDVMLGHNRRAQRFRKNDTSYQSKNGVVASENSIKLKKDSRHINRNDISSFTNKYLHKIQGNENNDDLLEVCADNCQFYNIFLDAKKILLNLQEKRLYVGLDNAEICELRFDVLQAPNQGYFPFLIKELYDDIFRIADLWFKLCKIGFLCQKNPDRLIPDIMKYSVLLNNQIENEKLSFIFSLCEDLKSLSVGFIVYLKKKEIMEGSKILCGTEEIDKMKQGIFIKLKNIEDFINEIQTEITKQNIEQKKKNNEDCVDSNPYQECSSVTSNRTNTRTIEETNDASKIKSISDNDSLSSSCDHINHILKCAEKGELELDQQLINTSSEKETQPFVFDKFTSKEICSTKIENNFIRGFKIIRLIEREMILKLEVLIKGLVLNHKSLHRDKNSDNLEDTLMKTCVAFDPITKECVSLEELKKRKSIQANKENIFDDQEPKNKEIGALTNALNILDRHSLNLERVLSSYTKKDTQENIISNKSNQKNDLENLTKQNYSLTEKRRRLDVTKTENPIKKDDEANSFDLTNIKIGLLKILRYENGRYDRYYNANRSSILTSALKEIFYPEITLMLRNIRMIAHFEDLFLQLTEAYSKQYYLIDEFYEAVHDYNTYKKWHSYTSRFIKEKNLVIDFPFYKKNQKSEIVKQAEIILAFLQEVFDEDAQNIEINVKIQKIGSPVRQRSRTYNIKNNEYYFSVSGFKQLLKLFNVEMISPFQNLLGKSEHTSQCDYNDCDRPCPSEWFFTFTEFDLIMPNKTASSSGTDLSTNIFDEKTDSKIQKKSHRKKIKKNFQKKQDSIKIFPDTPKRVECVSEFTKNNVKKEIQSSKDTLNHESVFEKMETKQLSEKLGDGEIKSLIEKNKSTSNIQKHEPENFSILSDDNNSKKELNAKTFQKDAQVVVIYEKKINTKATTPSKQSEEKTDAPIKQTESKDGFLKEQKGSTTLLKENMENSTIIKDSIFHVDLNNSNSDQDNTFHVKKVSRRARKTLNKARKNNQSSGNSADTESKIILEIESGITQDKFQVSSTECKEPEIADHSDNTKSTHNICLGTINEENILLKTDSDNSGFSIVERKPINYKKNKPIVLSSRSSSISDTKKGENEHSTQKNTPHTVANKNSKFIRCQDLEAEIFQKQYQSKPSKEDTSRKNQNYEKRFKTGQPYHVSRNTEKSFTHRPYNMKKQDSVQLFSEYSKPDSRFKKNMSDSTFPIYKNPSNLLENVDTLRSVKDYQSKELTQKINPENEKIYSLKTDQKKVSTDSENHKINFDKKEPPRKKEIINSKDHENVSGVVFSDLKSNESSKEENKSFCLQNTETVKIIDATDPDIMCSFSESNSNPQNEDNENCEEQASLINQTPYVSIHPDQKEINHDICYTFLHPSSIKTDIQKASEGSIKNNVLDNDCIIEIEPLDIDLSTDKKNEDILYQDDPIQNSELTAYESISCPTQSEIHNNSYEEIVFNQDVYSQLHNIETSSPDLKNEILNENTSDYEDVVVAQNREEENLYYAPTSFDNIPNHINPNTTSLSYHNNQSYPSTMCSYIVYQYPIPIQNNQVYAHTGTAELAGSTFNPLNSYGQPFLHSTNPQILVSSPYPTEGTTLIIPGPVQSTFVPSSTYPYFPQQQNITDQNQQLNPTDFYTPSICSTNISQSYSSPENIFIPSNPSYQDPQFTGYYPSNIQGTYYLGNNITSGSLPILSNISTHQQNTGPHAFFQSSPHYNETHQSLLTNNQSYPHSEYSIPPPSQIQSLGKQASQFHNNTTVGQAYVLNMSIPPPTLINR